ncbi:MAG TPA: hypothetical protein IAC62_13380 [Candidatus Pelethocola excrementipullorum]|nr:hypothetical protein [Candidatus Pelethocola excrementipullorum]
MISFAGCHDLRDMSIIKEIDCPRCGKKEGIEVIERDNQTVGESICDKCGYTIPEGVVLMNYLEQEDM